MPVHAGRRFVAGMLCLGILSSAAVIGQTGQEGHLKPTTERTASGLLGRRLDIPPAPTKDRREYTRAKPASAAFQVNRRSTAFPAARRLTAALALGVVGFLGGGLAGAAIEGRGCHCDDPGMRGFVIGAPIGAGAGFATGLLLAR